MLRGRKVLQLQPRSTSQKIQFILLTKLKASWDILSKLVCSSIQQDNNLHSPGLSTNRSAQTACSSQGGKCSYLKIQQQNSPIIHLLSTVGMLSVGYHTQPAPTDVKHILVLAKAPLPIPHNHLYPTTFFMNGNYSYHQKLFHILEIAK